MEIVFKNDEGTAFLAKGVFDNEELLEKCFNEVTNQLEERPEIIVFDKPCKQQRFVGFFSDSSAGYNYSGKTQASKPMTPSLTTLLFAINQLLGSQYNGILVNKYMDGKDYIGAHSDAPTGIDKIGVVSISYGHHRKFRIRDKKYKKIVHEEETTHSSILLMGGNFQELYTHEIPKQTKIKQSRTSFTFRNHHR